MKTYKIVVFGDLPIATKIAIWVQRQPELELVCGVLSNLDAHNNDPWANVPMFKEYCRNAGIKICSLEELPEFVSRVGTLDLGLLCRFSRIIKPEILRLFTRGIINMHGGLLPEVGGVYSSNYSVLLGHKLGGGTLHWVNESIDTGDIIRRCEFEITPEDTGYTVFQKTQEALYSGMIDIIMPILHGELTTFQNQKELIDQGHEHNYFKPGSLEQHKRLELSDDPAKILRTTRALDFPGYEPAYFVVDDRKIYLRTGI